MSLYSLSSKKKKKKGKEKKELYLSESLAMGSQKKKKKLPKKGTEKWENDSQELVPRVTPLPEHSH